MFTNNNCIFTNKIIYSYSTDELLSFFTEKAKSIQLLHKHFN